MRHSNAVILLTGFVALCAPADARAEPIGTAFTYQGQLKQGGVPADGEFDLKFTLYDVPEGSGRLEPQSLSVDDWPVNNGLFTVELDLGPNAFTGQARWLEVAVRSGDSEGEYAILSPRQPVTAAPYALHAKRAPWSGLVGVAPDLADGDDSSWRASEADIYNINTGNVGIGSETPEGVLHIAAWVHQSGSRMSTARRVGRVDVIPGDVCARARPRREHERRGARSHIIRE